MQIATIQQEGLFLNKYKDLNFDRGKITNILFPRLRELLSNES